jgi:hypothetical protein
MRPVMGWLLASLLALPSRGALADPVGYAAGFSDLYRIDFATGQATLVGPIGYNDVEGLAFAPNGLLYAVADASAGSGSGVTDFLIRIDPATGAGVLIAPLAGLAGQGVPGAGNSFELDYGLAFTADGRLWLSSDTTSLLWEVTPGTGATRLVGSTGARITGLAARGNDLYGVSAAGSESLYRINTGTGAATLVGSLGLSDRMYDAGLDFDANGRLWITIDYFSPPSGIPPLRNDLAEIDLGTGALRNQRQVAGAGSGFDTVQMEGLAIAPPTASGNVQPAAPQVVPGPGLPGLLLLIGVALGLGARRLRRA